MTEVLLTHSYFLRFDPKQWKAQRPYPPLATLYAGAVIRQLGIEPSFWDPMFARSAEEIAPMLELHDPKILVIYDDGFNYLTKMCLTNMRDAAFRMTALAKKRGMKVVVSSSDATDRSEKYFDAGVDVIIVGEAEHTLGEVIPALLEGGDLEQIHGIRYRDSEVRQTAPRANERDLDVFPTPAWDLVKMEEYRQRWMEKSGYFSLNQVTTRGCPFKCNWCAKPIYGNRYNSRSPEAVVEELAIMKERYGFDHIWFCDDIFGLKPGWVNRFADLVQERGLKFKFHIQSRADLLLQENNVAALARAGADEIWIGAESGSQKILDAMDKGTKVEQIREATRLMKKHGIKPCYFLQFGYPGEEMEDVKKTLQLVFDEMPHDIGVSVSYPLPGTKFYEMVKPELTEKQNWTDSDELLVMFEGTYPASFYRKLQRYVHHEFRKRQALQALSRMQSSSDLRHAATLSYRIPQSILSRIEWRRHV